MDVEIEDFLANKALNFNATLDKEVAYKGAEFVVIATPTDLDDVMDKVYTRDLFGSD